MKKYILLLLTCVAIIIPGFSKAQVADTTAYVQEIILNKSDYIGKPFSVLEKNMKIKFKIFTPFMDTVNNANKEICTFMGFRDVTTVPGFIVSWKPYLEAKKSDVLWLKNNGGEWTSEVSDCYREGIIEDIKSWNIKIDENHN